MGHGLKVNVNPQPKKEAYFPVEFDPNYQTKENPRNKWKFWEILYGVVQDLYKKAEFEFDTEKEKKTDENGEVYYSTTVKRPVIYADATEILETIVTEQGIVGNYSVKVMADYGQDFLKMSLSVKSRRYGWK